MTYELAHYLLSMEQIPRVVSKIAVLRKLDHWDSPSFIAPNMAGTRQI